MILVLHCNEQLFGISAKKRYNRAAHRIYSWVKNIEEWQCNAWGRKINRRCVWGRSRLRFYSLYCWAREVKLEVRERIGARRIPCRPWQGRGRWPIPGGWRQRRYRPASPPQRDLLSAATQGVDGGGPPADPASPLLGSCISKPGQIGVLY
jgi:hypothetical protein